MEFLKVWNLILMAFWLCQGRNKMRKRRTSFSFIARYSSISIAEVIVKVIFLLFVINNAIIILGFIPCVKLWVLMSVKFFCRKFFLFRNFFFSRNIILFRRSIFLQKKFFVSRNIFFFQKVFYLSTIVLSFLQKRFYFLRIVFFLQQCIQQTPGYSKFKRVRNLLRITECTNN